MNSVNNFLQKAQENLAVAEWALAQGYFNACVNRAYYAMYQAALASLIHYGLANTESIHRHEWVQASFAKELIHRQKTYPGLQGYLMFAQELRNQADYQEVSVSRKQAQQIVSRCKIFLKSISEDIQ